MAAENKRHYRAWRKYHVNNPGVYREIVRIAKAKHGNPNIKRYSMHGIFAIIRHEREEMRPTDGQFKINNNYSSFYSRLLRSDYPDMAYMFSERVKYNPGQSTILNA